MTTTHPTPTGDAFYLTPANLAAILRRLTAFVAVPWLAVALVAWLVWAVAR